MLNIFCSDSTHIHINCTHRDTHTQKPKIFPSRFLTTFKQEGTPQFFQCLPQHIQNYIPLHEFYFPSPLFNHIRNHVIHVTSPSSLWKSSRVYSPTKKEKGLGEALYFVHGDIIARVCEWWRCHDIRRNADPAIIGVSGKDACNDQDVTPASRLC